MAHAARVGPRPRRGGDWAFPAAPRRCYRDPRQEDRPMPDDNPPRREGEGHESDQRAAQEARADRLRRRVDEARGGGAPPDAGAPVKPSPRQFTDAAAAAERLKERKTSDGK